MQGIVPLFSRQVFFRITPVSEEDAHAGDEQKDNHLL